MMNILVKSVQLRTMINTIVFFVTIAFTSGRPIVSQTVSELIAQGDALHNQFDTYGAFKAYKAASILDSTNFEVLWKMAGELIDMGNELPKSNDQAAKYREAEAISRKAIYLNPNHAKGHLMLALALEKTALGYTGTDRVKTLNQSRIAAEKAVEINAEEDLALSLLGRWNREMTNTAWITRTFSKLFVVSTPPATYEKAADQLAKAIAINHNCISHYLELGKTYVLLEKWTEADEAFQKVMDLQVTQKSDSKWQRVAKHYLQLLQQGNHSELVDSIEE